MNHASARILAVAGIRILGTLTSPDSNDISDLSPSSSYLRSIALLRHRTTAHIIRSPVIAKPGCPGDAGSTYAHDPR